MRTFFSDKPHRWILIILLLEYVTMGFSGVLFSGLAGTRFFSPGIDPGQWLFFLIGLPQFLISHPAWALLADGCMLIGIAWLIRHPDDHRIARLLFLLAWCYYATLTACLGHRNFQSGMVFVFIPFLFRLKVNRYLAWEAVRYFILFFYVSAALFKICHTGLFDSGHMSQILTGQLAPYHIEQVAGIRMKLNHYLIVHPGSAQALFIGSVFIEFLPFAGFLTKRWDRFIFFSVILFHLVNWLIMDIAPIGQLAFLSLLLFPFDSRKP